MPKGAKFDAAGAAQCKATNADLMAKGAAACPAASRVGTGKATATNGTAVVDVAGFIFNEKAKASFTFVDGTSDSTTSSSACKP